MNRLFPDRVEREIAPWLSEGAQRRIWWTLVAFALLDWTHPQLALTQEWWCVLLVLWIVPWRRPAESAATPEWTAKRMSSLVLFAWLISRTETGVRESVSAWAIFRSSSHSQLLSFAWRGTIAALVTALATVIPLRRVFGGPAAKTQAVLACLPYSLRLAGHVFSFSMKPFAVPIALYALVTPALMMTAVLSFLRFFHLERERLPGYRDARAWVYGALKGQLSPCGGFVLYAATLAATFWLVTSWMGSGESSTWARSLLDTLLFPWLLSALILTAIAFWRSLTLMTHRNAVTNNLRTLARAIVVLTLIPGGLAGFFLGVPYSGEALSEAMQGSGRPGWSLKLSDTGRAIRISGEIRSGLSDALADLLEANPEVERLELESPGGSVREGLELAELVEKYSLDTEVRTYCDSACTLVFVAGSERSLAPRAALGFHRCRSVLWYYALLYDDEHNAELARYLQSKGVSQAFADKVISVSSDDIWYPSVHQLLAAGVMTETVASDAQADAS
jgi:hypothetical protein